LLKLSASSFVNTPRNLSDKRSTGFGSSIRENVTATCLPTYEGGTDTDTLDLRGVIIVLVITLRFEIILQRYENNASVKNFHPTFISFVEHIDAGFNLWHKQNIDFFPIFAIQTTKL